MKKRNIVIENAISFFGGSQVEMANSLGISKSQVWQWLNNVNQVSIERAIDIERHTLGLIKCEDLRPDVNWSILRNNGQ